MLSQNTGLTARGVVGALASELYGAGEPPFLEVYARVAETGEPCSFETYFPPLARHFRISVSSHARGYFTTVFEDITLRKAAEETLRRSERQLLLVTENMRDVMWLMDMSFRVTWVTPSIARLSGYSPAQVTQLSLEGQLTPASLQKAKKLIVEHLTAVDLADPQADITVAGEFELRRKDGGTVWGDTVVTVLRYEDGKPAGMLGVTRDITEKKKVEDALRDSEHRYRMLVENAFDAIFLLRGERYEYVNPRFCELTGYEHEELTSPGFDFYRLMTLEGGRVAGERTPSWVQGQEPTRQMQTQIRRESGDLVDVELSTVTLGSPDEVRILGIVRDVTERKKAEEALRESEARARSIYDHLPLPTFVWRYRDDGFVLVELNEAARRLGGGIMRGLVGRSVGEAPPLFADIAAGLRRCHVEKTSFKREVVAEIEPASGPRQLTLTFAGVPPDGVLIHMEDQTEYRRIEEQLRLSQKMEAVGRLAGGIAHDFNNIVTIINNYADFAARALRDGDPLRSDLEEIRKAGERAATLTGQLLAFSRKQVMQSEVLNLNRIVASVESMLRRLIGEDIELVTVLAGDLGCVKADGGQIEQVLMNLAINSRDAMPNGGKLTLETANVELDAEYAKQHVGVEPGPYVMLSVSDTGTGMDERTKARLFEPFFTTKEAGRGTGLGLAMVYGIVTQSGGNIWIYSEPGKGSTFKIYLPRELTAIEAEQRGRSRAVDASGSETILVVEDEDAVRHLTQRILGAAGYKVLTAANAGEALLLCEQAREPIHLLMTDVVMPKMSGRELAERLLSLRPGLRVLYTSGYTENAIVHRGVLDAGTHFVAKPFTAAELTQKVRQVLDAPAEAATGRS